MFQNVIHEEILKSCPQHVFIIVLRKIDIGIVRGLFVFFCCFFLLIFKPMSLILY